MVIGEHEHRTDKLLFDTRRANTIQGVRLSIVLSKCL
jgi:hypothetical protein